MLLSKQDMFSDEQTVQTTAAAIDSTNKLDFSQQGDDHDKHLRWFVLLHNTPVSAGSGTLTIEWKTSADDSNWTTVFATATLAAATLEAGAFLVNDAVLPVGLKRFNKLVFTTADANWTTAPQFTAGIVMKDTPIYAEE